jgi:hypothetical protein
MRGCHSPGTGRITAPGSSSPQSTRRAAEAAADLERRLDDGVARLGVKGAGEGAIIPIGGLMANAVANALTSFGAMPNHLPLSPARVWHMRSAKQSSGGSG